MKIVSKHKDFYDFLVQDYDSDLTYVRHIGLVNEIFDFLYRKLIPDRYYCNIYDECKKIGDFKLSNLVFGIYPFVFSQPILRIKISDYDFTILSLGRRLVDKLLDSKNKDELIQCAQDEFNKKGIGKVSFVFDVKDIQEILLAFTWKVECPNIFYKIESPVFVKYYPELFENGVYWDNWPEEPRIGDKEETYYVTDISFQKLNYNILKYWYDDIYNINTYNNIENFLWSIKQEPESIPDNKTKIISHGFDLKTSFRKC